MKKIEKSALNDSHAVTTKKHMNFKPVKRLSLLLLFLIPALALSGCISRSTYNRDMAKLLNKIKLDKQEYDTITARLEANGEDRAITLNKLTGRYMQLQKKHAKLQSRYNHFDKDLNEFSRDIAELKLVINKNMDKIKSSMANEMLIKIIDMEFRVEELRKRDAEELPLLPVDENGQFSPAAEPASPAK